jgi:hypothetical protein
MQRRLGWLYAAVIGCSLIALTRAWPTRADERAPLTIRVWKQRHEMWLEDGDQVIRKFWVALGKDPASGKLLRGDGRTPSGRYYICEKQPRSRFRKFLGISYPNIDDAERAFADRLITADEWADIFVANLRQTVPPWSTPMGGRVGIHGFGGRPLIPVDWTEGCIAVSDADIDYLYDRVPLGTPVVIND